MALSQCGFVIFQTCWWRNEIFFSLKLMVDLIKDPRYTPHCHRNSVPCLFLAPVPVSPAPRWCWLSAEPLQEFHLVYLRERRGRKRQKERQKGRKRERDTRQWNRKMDSNKNEGSNVWKGTHLMKLGERERNRFRKHPLTNMSFLTQSHLIDRPLLLCNLWGFEFWKKRNSEWVTERWVPTHFGQT